MVARDMKSLQNCEHCVHFRQEELPIGYCQFHEMYVLKDFDCGKFEQRNITTEGGDASKKMTRVESENA